jgi:hypothetical protein
MRTMVVQLHNYLEPHAVAVRALVVNPAGYSQNVYNPRLYGGVGGVPKICTKAKFKRAPLSEKIPKKSRMRECNQWLNGR